MNTPLIAPPPPSADRERMDFDRSEFDALIWNKGYDIRLEKAYMCPCGGDEVGNNAKATCRNCGGIGYIFVQATDTKVILHSMNLDTKFKDWSIEKTGTASVSAMDREMLSLHDRITLLKATATYSEIVTAMVVDGLFLAPMQFDPLSVESIFVYINDVTPLERLKEGVDYTIEAFRIRLNEARITDENSTLRLSIRYQYHPQFIVVDLVRELMMTSTTVNGSVGEQPMPIHAIARRSQYVLTRPNVGSTRLLNNSYPVDQVY